MSHITNKDDDDRVARLQRAGIISLPSEPLPLELLRTPPPRAERSVLEALLEERGEGQ